MKDETKITIRLPETLRRTLAELAETENRSLNGEIVDLLEWASEIRKNSKSQ